jgi:hypothetical protein
MLRLFLSAVIIAQLLCGATLSYAATDGRVRLAQACHPSYEGECVPITSDADCAGGAGNGPAYVNGPVRVVGPDEYGLDRDGAGIACER